MYIYETHMHTSEASDCAECTAVQMADKYKAEGYTGIIITDHFFNGNSSVPHDLPWEERVELYCKGYEHAKARGDEIGLDVFFGIEFGDGGSDYLIYGLDKQWLKKNEGILDMELWRFRGSGSPVQGPRLHSLHHPLPPFHRCGGDNQRLPPQRQRLQSSCG